jgi:diaminopimelate decarboxylase
MTTDTPRPSIRRDIAGASVADMAREFGTPLYVYDAETIRRRCRDLGAWDTIRFAQKACSNLAILALMRREGVLVDAVSTGEIHRALVAGYAPHAAPGAATAADLPPAHPIVYTADIFDRESLDAVARHGIHVNCGSADMIEQLAERVPGAASRSASIRGSATATARRRTPAARARSTASGMPTSPTCCAGRSGPGSPSPGCTCTSAAAPIWPTSPKWPARSTASPARSAGR